MTLSSCWKYSILCQKMFCYWTLFVKLENPRAGIELEKSFPPVSGLYLGKWASQLQKSFFPFHSVYKFPCCAMLTWLKLPESQRDFFLLFTQSFPTLWDTMDCSSPGFPVLHCVPELAQTHINWVCDAIQPSHPRSSPSPQALKLSQHQRLFQWVSSSHQVAKVLEFQLQHQSFQWTPRTDL